MVKDVSRRALVVVGRICVCGRIIRKVHDKHSRAHQGGGSWKAPAAGSGLGCCLSPPDCRFGGDAVFARTKEASRWKTVGFFIFFPSLIWRHPREQWHCLRRYTSMCGTRCRFEPEWREKTAFQAAWKLYSEGENVKTIYTETVRAAETQSWSSLPVPGCSRSQKNPATNAESFRLERRADSARAQAKNSREGYLTWQSMLRQFSNMVDQQSSIVLGSVAALSDRSSSARAGGLAFKAKAASGGRWAAVDRCSTVSSQGSEAGEPDPQSRFCDTAEGQEVVEGPLAADQTPRNHIWSLSSAGIKRFRTCVGFWNNKRVYYLFWILKLTGKLVLTKTRKSKRPQMKRVSQVTDQKRQINKLGWINKVVLVIVCLFVPLAGKITIKTTCLCRGFKKTTRQIAEQKKRCRRGIRITETIGTTDRQDDPNKIKRAQNGLGLRVENQFVFLTDFKKPSGVVRCCHWAGDTRLHREAATQSNPGTCSTIQTVFGLGRERSYVQVRAGIFP